MCRCTLYDSPICSHSWISMSQPCSFLSDLLSCPYRQIYQTLIAPPSTCPTCNGGFADSETIEMIQEPLVFNPMIWGLFRRNRAIPEEWTGCEIASGAIPNVMIPTSHKKQNQADDHRLTIPNNSRKLSLAAITNKSGVNAVGNHDGHSKAVYTDHGRTRTVHTSHYNYKYTEKAAKSCSVM